MNIKLFIKLINRAKENGFSFKEFATTYNHFLPLIRKYNIQD